MCLAREFLAFLSGLGFGYLGALLMLDLLKRAEKHEDKRR